MAQLVLGMGMSHSPMVTLGDSLWGEWAAQDPALAILYDAEGHSTTYEELAERAGDRYAQQATPHHWKKQCAAVRRAVARLASDVREAHAGMKLHTHEDVIPATGQHGRRARECLRYAERPPFPPGQTFPGGCG